MHQIFNIDAISSCDIGEIPSLGELRGQYIALHEQRRQILCVLLSVETDSNHSSWPTWREIIRELSGLEKLLNSFTRELQQTLLEEQSTPYIPTI